MKEERKKKPGQLIESLEPIPSDMMMLAMMMMGNRARYAFWLNIRNWMPSAHNQNDFIEYCVRLLLLMLSSFFRWMPLCCCDELIYLLSRPHLIFHCILFGFHFIHRTIYWIRVHIFIIKVDMRHTIQHTFTMCMHDNNNVSNKSQQKTNHTVSLCYARSFTWIQTHSIYSNCARTHSTHIRDQSLPLSQAQARTPQYKRAHFVGDTLFSRTVGAAAARCYHRRYICCFFLIVHMLMNSFYSLHLYRYSLHFRTFFFYTHTHSFAHWPNMREKKTHKNNQEAYTKN